MSEVYALKVSSVKKLMRKYCKPSNESAELMVKLLDDFTGECCRRSDKFAAMEKRKFISKEDLGKSIGK